MTPMENQNSILVILKEPDIADLIELVALESGYTCIKSTVMPEAEALKASNRIIVDIVTLQGRCYSCYEQAVETVSPLEAEILAHNENAKLVFLASMSHPEKNHNPFTVTDRSCMLSYPFSLEELEKALGFDGNIQNTGKSTPLQ